MDKQELNIGDTLYRFSAAMLQMLEYEVIEIRHSLSGVRYAIKGKTCDCQSLITYCRGKVKCIEIIRTCRYKRDENGNGIHGYHGIDERYKLDIEGAYRNYYLAKKRRVESEIYKLETKLKDETNRLEEQISKKKLVLRKLDCFEYTKDSFDSLFEDEKWLVYIRTRDMR